MKKKHKIESSEVKRLFYAIACNESFHKLTWAINESISMSFKEYDGINLDSASGEQVAFPVFKDDESHAESTIFIVKNRMEVSFLLPELPKIDYILAFVGNFTDPFPKDIVLKIKKLSIVLAVIPIDTTKVKSIKNLSDF